MPSQPADLVYYITKAMIANYDDYKDAAPGAAGLDVKRQNLTWVLPYHEGAVRALKEAGAWKAEHEAHNQKLLKRQETLAAAWAAFVKGNPPDDKDAFAKAWIAARKAALASAPAWTHLRIVRRARSAPQSRPCRRPAGERPSAIGRRRVAPRQQRRSSPGEPVSAGSDAARRRRRPGRVRRSRTPQRGPVEGEVTRVRKLAGFWRWLLVTATAATIFLCINQQFTLRFFVGYTQLNTEYYYLLIVCMLPFTFLIFPGSGRHRSTGFPGTT